MTLQQLIDMQVELQKLLTDDAAIVELDSSSFMGDDKDFQVRFAVNRLSQTLHRVRDRIEHRYSN